MRPMLQLDKLTLKNSHISVLRENARTPALEPITIVFTSEDFCIDEADLWPSLAKTNHWQICKGDAE